MSSPDARVEAHPEGNANQIDGKLRSKIVEILASTTNGCIEELGCHPAMIEKLQQATQLAQSLQEENGKLYQDNCRLAASFSMLKERATHLLATPDTRLQQFSFMQERIRTLESERITLARQNQEILISANKGTSHQHLVEELERLRAYANRVCKDLQILQEKYTMATQRSPGVLSPSNSVPHIPQPRIPTPSDRRVSVEGAPRLQPSHLPQQQFQQEAQHSRQMRPHVQLPIPSHQLQHFHPAHTQRKVSESVQNPYPPQRPLPMSQRYNYPPPASAPPILGARFPAEYTSTHPRVHTSQTVSRDISAPLVPFALYPKSNTTTSRPTLCVDLTGEHERMTERVRDGRAEKPNGLKRTISTEDGSIAQDTELLKRQRTAEPTQLPQDAIANLNPEPAASPDTVVALKPASPVSPSLPAPLAQETMDAASAGQVGVTNDEVVTAVTPSDTAVGSNPTSPSSVTPSPAQAKTSGPSSGDNLRPVEACVYMIYEPDAEVADGYFCGRCL
ncbi:hypothetical protein EDD22DRAFT_897308 [Suillus occidentalis]|nr:hypothetical protein EDD22DRAFT_897308 [Suillus occidentalis]